MLNNVKAAELNDMELTNVNGGDWDTVLTVTKGYFKSVVNDVADTCTEYAGTVVGGASMVAGGLLVLSGVGAGAGALLLMFGATIGGIDVINHTTRPSN